MKIKRFQAKTMREAMRLVREEQGPDAVILSNHRVADGVEVVAAVDYDAALMQQALRRPNADFPSHEQESPASAVHQPAPTPVSPLSMGASAAPRAPSVAPLMPSMRISTSFNFQGPAAIAIAAAPALAARTQPDLSPIPGITRAEPVTNSALAALISMGLDAPLAREIAAHLPADASEERARFLPLGLLARRLPVTKTDEVLEGGVIALLGPTGVGKTTTLAKLAARYIQKHGAHGVALVCTDHYRIGAQEQLATYGKLLGVPVHNASDARTLGQVLSHLKDHKLILIDTAGISQRDHKLAEQFITLSSQRSTIRKYLVLAANSQAEGMEEAVRKFGAIRPTGCIFTKLDETARVGGALSVAIRHQLPIAYTTDGQRVPEDLQFARAERLVIKAMQLARMAPPAADIPLSKAVTGASHAIR